jgi:hypothetical protein
MTRRELPGRSVAAGLGGRGNLPADSTLNAAARTKQIHVTPVVRHIDIKNVNSQKSKHAIFIDGYKNSPVGGVIVSDGHFQNSAKARTAKMWTPC